MAEALSRQKRSLIGALLGYEQSPEVSVRYTPESQYPGAADYESGQFYGSPWEAYTEGGAGRPYSGPPMFALRGMGVDGAGDFLVSDNRPVNNSPVPLPQQRPHASAASLREMYRRGLASANLSALASLGLRDLSRFNLDVNPSSANLGGIYDRATDRGYVSRALDESGQLGSTLPHEGAHRGYNLLRSDPRYAEATYGPEGEERRVRALIAALTGVEREGRDARGDVKKHLIRTHDDPSYMGLSWDGEKWNYDYGKVSKNREAQAVYPAVIAEFLAADKIARDRPGGPR